MTTPSAKTRAFEPVEGPDLEFDPTTQVTRVFVYFLQNLFREFPEGYGMRWRPEEENTELVITSEKPRLEAIEKTPHITCVLGALQWANLSLDQFQNSRMSDGQRIHTDLIPATMAYHCQAKEGLVARRIAWYASKYTNVFRRIIMRGGHLHHVSPRHTMSAETGPTAYTGPVSETELVAVVVTIPFYWQDRWLITRSAPLFRSAKVDLGMNSVNPIYSASRTNKIRNPTIKGRPVVPVLTEPSTALNLTVIADKEE